LKPWEKALKQSVEMTDLEINIHTLRKPRLIILNIPEDISTTDIEDRILMQNPDLNLRKGEIVAKFSYVTKKMNRNLVVEVGQIPGRYYYKGR